MYAKKILIFNNVDNRYAVKGRQLCGMVKLEGIGNNNLDGKIFVTNVKESQGDWRCLVRINRNIYSRQCADLNNFAFTLPCNAAEDIACVLVNVNGENFAIVGWAYLGNKGNLDYLLAHAGSVIKSGGEQWTEYEKFVAATADFYGETKAVDVDSLIKNANSKYKSVEEYSTAFDKYYAGGRQDNYYQSVKKEITNLFLQFPPYYPLIKQFPDCFFIRVDFPAGDKFFVMGLLQKDNNVRYICYGLPGTKDGFEDKDFSYLPCGDGGFWMLYQDADTGQITSYTE